MSRTGACLAAALAFAGIDHAQAQYVERGPSPQTIARTAAQLKNTYTQYGITGLSIAVQSCYDKNIRNNRELLACMLLDVSAIKLDRGMRQELISRGAGGGITVPYFSDSAISARLDIYTDILFNGNARAATSYLSDASNKVIAQASPR